MPLQRAPSLHHSQISVFLDSNNTLRKVGVGCPDWTTSSQAHLGLLPPWTSSSRSALCYTLPVRRPGAPSPNPVVLQSRRLTAPRSQTAGFAHRGPVGLWADCSRVQAQSQQGRALHSAQGGRQRSHSLRLRQCALLSPSRGIAVQEKSSGTERSCRTANSGGFKMQAQMIGYLFYCLISDQ